MLPIYLCDDNPEEMDVVADIIEKAILIEEMDMKIMCKATTPQELLCRLPGSELPGLYFLDVRLSVEVEGFLLAQRIREYDPRGFIVFVTTHSEFSRLAFEYQVEALDYILKDHIDSLPDKVKNCMMKAEHLYTSSNNSLHRVIKVKVGPKYLFLKAIDIYSIETFGEPHRIRIYEKSSYSDFFYTLNEINAGLPDDFYQCHKSCIINMNHVKEICRQERTVILDNNRKCPVSNRSLNSLCKKSCNYLQKYYNQK